MRVTNAVSHLPCHSSRLPLLLLAKAARTNAVQGSRNPMPTGHAFFSYHRQGFVRVAACTPRICVGDPKSNAEETLALIHEGEARSVDLMLFPELGLSAPMRSTTCCCRTRCSKPSRPRIARLARSLASDCGRCSSSARRFAATAVCTTAVVVIARGRILGVVAEIVSAELPRVLRASLVRARRGLRRARGDSWQARPHRSAPT